MIASTVASLSNRVKYRDTKNCRTSASRSPIPGATYGGVNSRQTAGNDWSWQATAFRAMWPMTHTLGNWPNNSAQGVEESWIDEGYLN